MKYVLDACVALKWVLIESDTDRARRLRDDYRGQRHELIAPDLFELEVAHGLSKAERKGILAPPEGGHHLLSILTDLPALVPCSPLLIRAFTIASQARISVYDCFYVALAEREGCELVTSDEKLIKNLQTKFSFIISLSSL